MILVSSALVGCVQAWIGKLLLPRFGGTPSVWDLIACGTGAAAWLGILAGFVCTRLATIRVQAAAVAAGWAAASAALALSAPSSTVHEQLWPSVASVALLLAALGATLVVLPSLIAHLEIQRVRGSRLDPYPLLAVGFFGTCLGNLGYVTAIEPSLSLTAQGLLWKATAAGIGFLLLPALALCWRPIQAPSISSSPAADSEKFVTN